VAVGLVDGAIGFYPQRVLADTATVAEARGPVVAGTGVVAVTPCALGIGI
jgi:hypothetical protein